jgi:beta-lactamase class A
VTRRSVLISALAIVPGLPQSVSSRAAGRLAALERTHGGTLGVAAFDSGNGHRLEYRAGDRFPMCSTFKVLAAALVLTRAARKDEQLDRRVIFQQPDLVEYSPVTSRHVGAPGMTMAEICEAALTMSDNTAGNLMLASFGGPAGLTAYARSLGDRITRLDRNETSLNEAREGDPRDTTSPRAMAGDLQQLILGDALTPAARDRLTGWMAASTTGTARIRADLPAGWRVADKTGTGGRGSTNDIAVIWPPGRKPIALAVYYVGSTAEIDVRNGVIAEVARMVAAGF